MDNMKPKPICIIKVQLAFLNLVHRNASELMNHYAQEMPDYHVFVLPIKDSMEEDMMEVTALYEKDFVEEHTDYVRTLIKKLTDEIERQQKQDKEDNRY